MRCQSYILITSLALLIIGLITVTVTHTSRSLQQIRDSRNEKALILTRTMINAVRGVMRHGLDREKHLQDVLEETTSEPSVLTAAIFRADGTLMVVAGATLSQFPKPQLTGTEQIVKINHTLLVTAPFEIEPGMHHRHRRGCRREQLLIMGMEVAHYYMGPGYYSLMMAIDASSEAAVRTHIIIEGIIQSAILVFLGLAVTLLGFSLYHRGALTRRIALECQKRENLESLEMLASGLAHEIRNPLGAIRGFTQLLQKQLKDEESKDHASIMLKELDRIRERLTEFLGFARKRAPNLESINIVTIAQEVITLLASDIKIAGIGLVFDGPYSEVIIQGDRSQFKELLTNLVLNAIQACHQGDQIKVAILKASKQIEVSVADTGVGMTAQDLARAFEPYFTTKETGSGLGLAISRRIADSHGATLFVESEPGLGTHAKLAFRPAPRPL